jgi:hypothetical protein
MITSRDRVIRTLQHGPIDRLPRDLWAMPSLEMLRGDELAEMNYRYPNDVVRPDFRYPRGHRVKGTPNEVGQYTDAWGCTWQVNRRSSLGELEYSPLADLRQLATFQPPSEILETADFTAANRSCAATSRFVLAWTDVRPLERLQLLCGAEPALADLASGTKPVRDLVAVLHDFYCRELSLWAATDVDGVVFRDDWGTSQGLLLPPQVFRDLFRPLYRDYCQILRAKDKFVFFRCGGNIEAIFEDLVSVGVDAIHSQLLSVNIDRLAARFRGRVTFWGGLDRQPVLAQGTPDDVKAAVGRVRAALDFGHGGLIAQCEWDNDAPFRNVAAALEQWLVPISRHAQAS